MNAGYGGRYGPGFAAFFQQQNEKISNRTWTISGEMYYIHLEMLVSSPISIRCGSKLMRVDGHQWLH